MTLSSIEISECCISLELFQIQLCHLPQGIQCIVKNSKDDIFYYYPITMTDDI